MNAHRAEIPQSRPAHDDPQRVAATISKGRMLAAPQTSSPPAGTTPATTARAALSSAAGLAALWSIDVGASAAVSYLHVPVPGNVVGLAILFALLCSGTVKASWFEPAATFMVKHLAFFFIPITAGLMSMGPLFALHGVGILMTLAVSAGVGMAVCGLSVQCLMKVRDERGAALGSERNA